MDAINLLQLSSRKSPAPSAGLLIGVWIGLLAGLLVLPALIQASNPGELLTRNTIRLSLAYYALAVVFMLALRPEEWAPSSSRGRRARWCWTLSLAAYLIHVGLAFHHYHGWSHAHAVAHTAARSGWGEGIYVSHLFGLLWTLDVLFWWLRPAGYAARPHWVGGLLHGFMVFIIFNGAVVFESGPTRWVGALVFALLAWLALTRLRV
jgi:hypothetical protein